MPPVYLTSTFESGNPDGFDYTRSGNPNFRLLQESVAALEGARHATCFASGVSAITAVVSTLRSGDLVLAEENLYGCTYRLFERVFAKFGLRTQYLDLSQTANWEAIPRLRPALIWLESPTNPLLKILDIEGISRVGAAAGAPVLVDNTFASPYLPRPLGLGATLSLASTTKYINGHSDCLGGEVATNDAGWQEKMIFAQKALGLQPSPFDAWLTTRGQFTLAESLGGVESLVCHPATMTHASVPAEVRRKVGIGDGLLRLSVGVEDVEDLRSDLEEALQAVLQRSES